MFYLNSQVGIVKVDAEQACSEMMRRSKEELQSYMRGTKHICVDSIYSDIYYIYSRREKKNIPVQFYYMEYPDSVLRVYKVEFVSRKSDYPTSDLRTAFWIEYLKGN